jgi:hypothetical protein
MNHGWFLICQKEAMPASNRAPPLSHIYLFFGTCYILVAWVFFEKPGDVLHHWIRSKSHCVTGTLSQRGHRRNIARHRTEHRWKQARTSNTDANRREHRRNIAGHRPKHRRKKTRTTSEHHRTQARTPPEAGQNIGSQQTKNRTRRLGFCQATGI